MKVKTKEREKKRIIKKRKGEKRNRLEHIKRSWSKGRMLPSQGSDPGSSPGGRIFEKAERRERKDEKEKEMREER